MNKKHLRLYIEDDMFTPLIIDATACGLILGAYENTSIKSLVTCENCKRTKKFNIDLSVRTG